MRDVMRKVYKYKGKEQTALDHCKDLGLPERIVKWRIEKGFNRNCIFEKIKRPILLNGEVWTARMLSEHYNISEHLINGRWTKGKRGKDLVAQVSETVSNDMNCKDRLIEINRQFLYLLIKEFPDRAKAILKGTFSDDAEATDQAAGSINAQRIYSDAIGCQVRSTGQQWDV